MQDLLSGTALVEGVRSEVEGETVSVIGASPSPDHRPCLVDDHTMTAIGQMVGGDEAGQSGADDGHPGPGPTTGRFGGVLFAVHTSMTRQRPAM